MGVDSPSQGQTKQPRRVPRSHAAYCRARCQLPALLTRRYDAPGVRILATPVDHSVTAAIEGDGRMVVTAGQGQIWSNLPVDSHGDVGSSSKMRRHRTLRSTMYIRTLPLFGLQAFGLPADAEHTHGDTTTNMLHMHRQLRGVSKRPMRTATWKTSSRQAAAGLALLEWRRIRRILGLGPWGEHVLYCMKARAYSMYDSSNSKIGCPHAECVHEPDVDAYYVSGRVQPLTD